MKQWRGPSVFSGENVFGLIGRAVLPHDIAEMSAQWVAS